MASFLLSSKTIVSIIGSERKTSSKAFGSSKYQQEFKFFTTLSKTEKKSLNIHFSIEEALVIYIVL